MSLKILFSLFLVSITKSYAVDLPEPSSTPVAPQATTIQLPSSHSTSSNGKSGQNSGTPKVIRKKELNFEGRGVEVLLGKDYDSLSQTGAVDSGNRDKLYKTRQFMNESENLLQELEYQR